MRGFPTALLCLLLAAAFLPSDCEARAVDQHYAPVKGEKVAAYHTGDRVRGVAAWYGGARHVTTSSGERFDSSLMTAAHRTLPFGTRVKVTNRSNGRSVVVKVNDRGPMTARFCIDLSRGAAARIGMLHAGTAQVEMEVLELPSWYEGRRAKKRGK
ncbi:MAG: septal ring lytic transglycosylase RlpA family protein [Mailhella sp.]|nr:septal ring lytic transglycosylase RlpA family protein [Mailhella sp.]